MGNQINLWVVALLLFINLISINFLLADDQNIANNCFFFPVNFTYGDKLGACGEFHDTPCNCENQTIKCYYSEFSRAQLPNIFICDPNKIIKHASFVYYLIKKLEKDKILTGSEKMIETLDFYYIDIEYIEAKVFDKFTSLKSLNLGRTGLKNISNEILTPQLGSTLLKLNLNFNEFQKISDINFKYLTKLDDFNFGSNLYINFSSNGTFFPKELSNLKSLNLEQCEIEHLNPEIFIYLKNIQMLNLRYNPITSIPTIALKNLPNLLNLNLIDTNIEQINKTDFQFNPNIEIINANGSILLKKINDCAFCNLSKLKIISFDNCATLSFIHENAFGCSSITTSQNSCITFLETFSIRKTKIATFSEKLLNWKKVKNISIYGNPFLCDCKIKWLIDDLKATNPLFINKLVFKSNDYMKYLYCQEPQSLDGVEFSKVPDLHCPDRIKKKKKLSRFQKLQQKQKPIHSL